MVSWVKSKQLLFLVASFGIILLISSQVGLTLVLKEFSPSQYEIKKELTTVISSPVNSSPDTITIELEDPSGFFVNSSYYNYGIYWSDWNYSHHLFRFDFDRDYQKLVNYSMWPTPIDLLSISISEFTGNGTHFWFLEWRNASRSNLQFIYSFDLTDFQLTNYSLPILEDFHSATRLFWRKDLAYWNDSLWVLEQWDLNTNDVNSDEIGTKSNVTVYSVENYERIRSFEVSVDIWNICFDEHGQLWESYPFREDSVKQISKVNGSLINRIKGNFRKMFDEVDPLLYSDYKHELSMALIRNHSIFRYFFIGNGQYLSGFLFTPFVAISFPQEAFLISTSMFCLGIICEIFVVILIYKRFKRDKKERLN